jgi:type I restriction enzyme S subunit
VGRKGAAGSVHVVPESSWPIDTAYYVQPPEGLNFKWLYYYLGTCRLVQLDKSTAIPSLSRDDLYRVNVPIAPSAEQQRIVAKLEELLSDLDAGVAELKAAQKKLQQYRQSLLKAAVEGALTADWRKAQRQQGTPTETGAQLLVRILTERRARWEARQLAKFKEQGKTPPEGWQKKYPEPVQPDTTDLPALPDGWVWASVDHLLVEIETGKSFKCEERPPKEDEIGVMKVSAVTWGEYDEKESKTCTDFKMIRPELFVSVGDFLFSRANTIDLVGACVIAKQVTKRMMLSDKILRFILVEESVRRWLLTLLRSEFGRQQIELLATGNQESMRNIGQERIRQIAVPLPPTREIHCALEVLETSLSISNKQGRATDHLGRQCSAQRQNILRAAFAGQLVPQDPNDEPADELLRRICTERKKLAGVPNARRPKKCAEA